MKFSALLVCWSTAMLPIRFRASPVTRSSTAAAAAPPDGALPLYGFRAYAITPLSSAKIGL